MHHPIVNMLEFYVLLENGVIAIWVVTVMKITIMTSYMYFRNNLNVSSHDHMMFVDVLHHNCSTGSRIINVHLSLIHI